MRKNKEQGNLSVSATISELISRKIKSRDAISFDGPILKVY